MESRKPSVPRVFTIVMGALMCLSFALLIWAKLRMLQGVPRTAYAEPETSQTQQPHQPKDQGKVADPSQLSIQRTQQRVVDQGADTRSATGTGH